MLCQLKMTVPLAEKYQGKKERRQKLIDIIEKPIWQGIDTEAKAADTPVSYTHLDVYKRQVIDHTERALLWITPYFER